MKSKLVNHFGSSQLIRRSMKDEILRFLDNHATYTKPDNAHFSCDWHGASDDEIRALRKRAKGREHIYNYERSLASHIWKCSIWPTFDNASIIFATYSSKTKTMQINENHHPILVKLLISTLAHHRPDIKVVTGRWGGEPRYRFDEGRPEPRVSLNSWGNFNVPYMIIDESERISI